MRRLAVIPCSKEKIWDTRPALGAVAARQAYTSPFHQQCRALADQAGVPWVILSALHGFLAPNDAVPGPYDVTFSRAGDPVVTHETLQQQACELPKGQLWLLLPDDYSERVVAAVAQERARDAQWPFRGIEGLPDLVRHAQAMLNRAPLT